MAASPDLDEQRRFWDEWNTSHRIHEIDGFMARQVDESRRAAQSLVDEGHGRLEILDVGCGTGWLAGSLTGFGQVTATDLAERSVSFGRMRHPDVRFVVGDFQRVDLDGAFDLVVSADTIAHVGDQPRFIDRVAALLRPNGIFLLMTQNAFVWRRSSYLAPQGEGQIRNWPSLGLLRRMLDDRFDIRSVGSIDPGGDLGVLRIGAWTRRAGRALGVDGVVRVAQERLRIGRELVITARLRAA